MYNGYSVYIPPLINEESGHEWFYTLASEAFTSAYIKSRKYNYMEVRLYEDGKIIRKWVIDCVQIL